MKYAEKKKSMNKEEHIKKDHKKSNCVYEKYASGRGSSKRPSNIKADLRNMTDR